MLSLRGSNVTLRQHSWSLSLGSGRMCTATILTWKWPAEYTAVQHHTNVRRWTTTLHYKGQAAEILMQKAWVKKYCLTSYTNFILWFYGHSKQFKVGPHTTLIVCQFVWLNVLILYVDCFYTGPIIIHIYDQNMLPNNVTHDKSDLQTDLERYWMIHILSHQH